MDFEYSPKVKELQKRLTAFMDEHIYPNEKAWYDHCHGPNRWQPVPIIEELKPKARAAGLWNLFLPRSQARAGGPLQPRIRAAVRDHGPRELVTPRCSTARRPTPATWRRSSATAPKRRRSEWLEPLLRGEIRSAFLMTEPGGRVRPTRPTSRPHQARGRRLRHQRPQVVVVRRRRPALQGLHPDGQDLARQRPRATASSR